ncbi:hypothetical protein [Staphylococcus sp. 11261D007BR]
MGKSELIVMLTYNDYTVDNAYHVFESCKDTKAQYWGFKDEGLPKSEMKSLFTYMKECGKTTVLEIVAYTEEEGLNGAQLAQECGCDILMGTTYFPSIHTYCLDHNIKYMPFAGNVYNRPSILTGSVEEIINNAQEMIDQNIFGVDLLGYRYDQDASVLISQFLNQVNAPVCLAGSIQSYEQLDFIKNVSPQYFTIGSAFFDRCFGEAFYDQIDTVCDYLAQ